MQFPEGVPHVLPISSLAIPPVDYDKHPTRINLNDMQLELSEEIDEDSNDHQLERQSSKEDKKVRKANQNFTFIRECFKYEDSFGYLLSNGIVGCFNKEQKTNLIL